MGEMAELMLEGVLCRECGTLIEDDDWKNAGKQACGYPRLCWDCGGDPECNGATVRKGYKN